MTVRRRQVLERLAVMSDADSDSTTTIGALATSLNAEAEIVAEHVERLQACELALEHAGAEVRVTVTGEELLALDTDDVVIVDPPTTDGDP